MKILILCGYFEPIHQKEITSKTKTWVENAANNFQKRLLEGFDAQGLHPTVVSAPFIGTYPNAYRDIFFRGFEKESSDHFGITYVHFNNIWGYRNLSRTKALKREVNIFLSQSVADPKAIIIYSPHTPFLEAAVYAKKIDPSVHIHMIVPDLPQYMNLSKNPHPMYRFFKKIDIKRFNKLSAKVDSFTLLTEPMAEVLHVGDRPYIIVEAIADSIDSLSWSRKQSTTVKEVLYAGKLQEAFGIKKLLDAFSMIRRNDVRLRICGDGECKEDVVRAAQHDNRICYYGIVTAEHASELIQKANVLVNPRCNDCEYTKYSFPSKNLEYLLSGNPVVAYMLDGMPHIYSNFLIQPEDESPEALAYAIEKACEEDYEVTEKRNKQIFAYVSKNLSAAKVTDRIISMIQMF